MFHVFPSLLFFLFSSPKSVAAPLLVPGPGNQQIIYRSDRKNQIKLSHLGFHPGQEGLIVQLAPGVEALAASGALGPEDTKWKQNWNDKNSLKTLESNSFYF